MKVIGLTGSIAMGKSEVARILAKHGVPVQDADAVVHSLYEDGTGARALRGEFSDCVEGEKVNREALSRIVLGDAIKLRRLEQLMHPLVRERQVRFLAEQREKGEKIVVLSVPLLMETGRQAEFDATIVVSAPEALQRQRALARGGMTGEKLQRILERQMPDAEKRKRATHIIENGGDLAELERRTLEVLADIEEDGRDA